MPALTARPSQELQTTLATSFENWRHLVGQSFVPLAAETADPDAFRGTMRSRVLDRMCIVEVSASSHQVRRTPALLAQSDQRYFKLNLQLEGTGLLIQDNREATLQPGDLAIYDTTRPYTLAFEDRARVLVVMFPHDMLTLPPDYVGQLSAVRMAAGSGLTGLVSPFMARIAENLKVLNGPSGSRLAGNVLDLVSTMLHSELDLAQDTMKPKSLLANSIREYIEANLADPQLSPSGIAAAHFISTRHLHNVFHEFGTTVACWIRSQRLEGAGRDLRDPLQAGKSVGAIAAGWGFVDAAHFSRSFREAFGQSPSDWRRGN